LLVALVVSLLLAVPEADAKGAKGAKGGRSGGHASARRAPRVSTPRRVNKAPAHKAPAQKAPKMPHAAAPSRGNTARANTANGNKQARSNKTKAQASTGTKTQASTGRAATTTAAVNPARTSASQNSYTYGTGTKARNYRAQGYGRGYRNRYNGGNRGYGRSQGNNRAIVSRLRSVHASLARVSHTYQGHRTRAMHSISMAIRQLSHRSMVYRGTGFASGVNNGLAMGTRRGANAGVRQQRPLTQAQSDARMSQALRTTQGIHMQLSNQGYQTSSHARARGHVQRAIRELNTALAIR
jgi:hypothetical protein